MLLMRPVQRQILGMILITLAILAIVIARAWGSGWWRVW